MDEKSRGVSDRAKRALKKARSAAARGTGVASLAGVQAENAKLHRQLGQLRKRVRALELANEKHLGSAPQTPLAIGPVTEPISPGLEKLITSVRKQHITFLSVASLRTLSAAMTEIEEQGIEGCVLEAGTARGGSAIVLAATKAIGRPMRVYDVFGTIPPPTERDGADVHERYATIKRGEAKGIGGDTYYGYRENLLDEVTQSFVDHGLDPSANSVELVPGLFEDTITVDGPVALAHLDGDWYESTMTCLTRIAPRLSRGGRLVIDDYDAWSGCRIAIDEYFAVNKGYSFERRGKLHIVKM